MYQRAWLSIFAAVLGGCWNTNEDTTSFTGSFATMIGANQALEVEAYVALRDEDRLLRFLSRGEYSCGDPKSVELRRSLDSKDPLADVVARYNRNSDYQAALKYINDYEKLLKDISDDNTESAQLVASITNFLTSASLLADTTSVASAAIKATGPAAERLRAFAMSKHLEQVARLADPKLKIASEQLGRAYADLQLARTPVYKLWEQCARERLIFIRDAPLGNVKGFEAYFAQTSGIELSNSYLSYRAKQRQLSSATDPRAALKKLMEANKQIINGAANIALKDLFDAGAEITTATKAFEGALDAAEKQREQARKERIGNAGVVGL